MKSVSMARQSEGHGSNPKWVTGWCRSCNEGRGLVLVGSEGNCGKKTAFVNGVNDHCQFRDEHSDKLWREEGRAKE